MRTLEPTELRLKAELFYESMTLDKDTKMAHCTFYWDGIRLDRDLMPEDVQYLQPPCRIEVGVHILTEEVEVDEADEDYDGRISIWYGMDQWFSVDEEVFLRNFNVAPAKLPIRKVYTCHNCTRMINKVENLVKEMCSGE